MVNAVVIDAKDNVAVAIEPLKKGSKANIRFQNGKEESLAVTQDIPIYHKFAIRDIPQAQPVVKYGEHIGIASCDIHQGDYVHVHNVGSHRENLEAEV
ncbi:UxaA family hydrolase [uncultured Acidaminococcus sp.]|jgi:altronate dehydratase small subunit|uniref:UxaA family hydrolase n=1 Tax=uncultured Acidaminococcus sp. TaxID=352152 RepID=UPI00258EE840|nr:UxaA family hydrolase [uncultured Acidaminococcus sp.]